MNKNNTLVTVAMLTSFLSKEHKDYLDLLAPFALKSLPNKIDQKINISSLMEKMKCEFGFEDLPINVLKRILDRLCKSQYRYLRKTNYEYYNNKIYDSSNFENNQRVIAKSLLEVTNSLIEYYENNTFEKITLELAEKYLFNFLDYYGYTIFSNFDALRSLTKVDRNNYHVARFIIKEHEKKSETFYCIIEVVKGFYVYKSIYFFSTDQKKTLDSKLKNTKVYIDTRLVINALGYHLEQDRIATRELFNLITESNGQLRVFEHTVDEVSGILTKYAKDPGSRPTMTLDYFDQNAYEEVDVIRLRNALSLNLKKINVEIDETPCHDASSKENLEDRGFIDEIQLKNHLIEYYQQVNKDPKEESIDRDINSISSISRLRGKPKNAGIESCNAIFVTHNLIISKAVNDFFKERFNKGEISFVLHEMDLTALLWLRSFDKKSDIPTLKLLENAYSAIKPSNEVLVRFNDQVLKVENEGILTKEEALLVRTQHAPRQDLAELSQNDPNKIDSDMIVQIKDSMLKSLTVEKDRNIESLINEINEGKRKKARSIEKAEIDSREKSDKYYDKITFGAKVILIMITLLGIAIFIIQFIADKDQYYFILIPLFMMGFGIITLISFISGKRIWVDKLLIKMKNKRFDSLYKTELERINKYFD